MYTGLLLSAVHLLHHLLYLLVCLSSCACFYSQLFFVNTCQKVINAVVWLDECFSTFSCLRTGTSWEKCFVDRWHKTWLWLAINKTEIKSRQDGDTQSQRTSKNQGSKWRGDLYILYFRGAWEKMGNFSSTVQKLLTFRYRSSKKWVKPIMNSEPHWFSCRFSLYSLLASYVF